MSVAKGLSKNAPAALTAGKKGGLFSKLADKKTNGKFSKGVGRLNLDELGDDAAIAEALDLAKKKKVAAGVKFGIY